MPSPDERREAAIEEERGIIEAAWQRGRALRETSLDLAVFTRGWNERAAYGAALGGESEGELARLRQGLEDALEVSFVVGLLRLRASKQKDAELEEWGERLNAQLVAIREVLSPGTADALAALSGHPGQSVEPGEKKSNTTTSDEHPCRCGHPHFDGCSPTRESTVAAEHPETGELEAQEQEARGHRIAGVEYEGPGREWWLYRTEDGQIVAALTGDLGSTGLRLGEKLVVVPKGKRPVPLMPCPAAHSGVEPCDTCDSTGLVPAEPLQDGPESCDCDPNAMEDALVAAQDNDLAVERCDFEKGWQAAAEHFRRHPQEEQR